MWYKSYNFNDKLKDNGGNTEWVRRPFGVNLTASSENILLSVSEIEKYISMKSHVSKNIIDTYTAPKKLEERYNQLIAEYDELKDHAGAYEGSRERLEEIEKQIVELEQLANGYYSEEDAQIRYLHILSSIQSSDDGGIDGMNKYGFGDELDIDICYNSPGFNDTRIGCNDVMNPYWQFNRDDDICPPSLSIESLKKLDKTLTSRRDLLELNSSYGMGRVYYETYESQQQILWLQAGVPVWTNLLDYYRDAGNVTVAAAINNGDLSNILMKITSGLLKITAFVLTAGLLAAVYVVRWIDRTVNNRITKYYWFKATMPLYYSMVNSMLQYTAVSMGLHPYVQTINPKKNSSSEAKAAFKYRNIVDDSPIPEDLLEKAESGYVDKKELKKPCEYPGVPEVIRDGCDIFKIMNRRSRQILANRSAWDRYVQNDKTTDELLIDGYRDKNVSQMFESGKGDFEKFDKKEVDESTNAVFDAFQTGSKIDTNTDYQNQASIRNELDELDGKKEWFSALKGMVMGSGTFVGFKVEKGVSNELNATNSTGACGLAEKLNSQSSEARNQAELYGHDVMSRIIMKQIDAAASGGIDQMLGGFVDSIKNAITKGATQALAVAAGFDIGHIVTGGNGFLEIPEIWKSSDCKVRGSSFTFKLRSRYGDPVSIFQTIYIPLFLLMGFALPRAIGDSSYTSPFIIRAYCKGMLNIPLGMVTSLSIRKGQDEFGWNDSYQPLVVEVTMEVTNLSPTLFLSMSGGIIDTFTRNSSIQAYLDTLAGLGLKEMIYWWPKMMRKANAALATARTTIFNPSYWGTRLGGGRMGQFASIFVSMEQDLASNK